MKIVDEVFAKLTKGGSRAISLDEIGEAIGARFVTTDEIEKIFQRLEAAGNRIVSLEGVELLPTLALVLRTARELKSRGEKAGVDELATATGLPAREVRVALLYGEVLARGKSA